jgi:hypothetical protein
MNGLSRQAVPRRTSQDLVAWRTAHLRAAGLASGLAEKLARDGCYDLHALLALVDRGCPAELAARILAPLDADGERRS